MKGNNIVFLEDFILATVTAVRVLRLRQQAVKGCRFKGIYTRCRNFR